MKNYFKTGNCSFFWNGCLSRRHDETSHEIGKRHKDIKYNIKVGSSLAT